jgi:hypothetical protein
MSNKGWKKNAKPFSSGAKKDRIIQPLDVLIVSIAKKNNTYIFP